MKLIIDIDEEYYKIMKEWNDAGVGLGTTDTSIANGIPLKDEVMLATLMSLVTDKDYKPNLEGEKE